MGDTMVQRSFGDVILAEGIIAEYADGPEGLSSKECADLGIERQRCDVLTGVLQTRRGGIVTDEERQKLAESGFSSEFILTIAGADGKRALKERVKWLGDHCARKLWGFLPETNELATMVHELGTIGAEAEPAIPSLIEALGYHHPVNEAAIEALRKIGIAAVPALIRALIEGNPHIRMEAAVTLGKIGREEALPALESISQSDPFQWCRDAAKEAIGKIEGQ